VRVLIRVRMAFSVEKLSIGSPLSFQSAIWFSSALKLVKDYLSLIFIPN
jgi:hypothetical protein